MSSTTLCLTNAASILADQTERVHEAATCGMCERLLVGETFNICKQADPVPVGEDGKPIPHRVHTVCRTCADPVLYVAAGGACHLCLEELVLSEQKKPPGEKKQVRRNLVSLAGLALVPPNVNKLATSLLKEFAQTEKNLEDVKVREEDARIQEQAARRAEHAQDVRRRRAEEEEERQRVAQEAAARELSAAKAAAEEEIRAAQQQAAIATKEAEEAREAAVKQAKEAREAAGKEAREVREAAVKEAREAREAAVKETQEAVEAAVKQAREAAVEQAKEGGSAPTKKRKQMEPEARAERARKMKSKADEKRLKIEQYDELVAQNELLTRKLSTVMTIAQDHITRRVFPSSAAQPYLSEFQEAVESSFSGLEEEDGAMFDLSDEEVDCVLAS